MCQNLVSGILFLILLLLLNHFVFTISLVIVKPPLQQVWQYSYFHLRTVHQLQPIYTCNADIHDNLAERELQEPLEHGVSDWYPQAVVPAVVMCWESHLCCHEQELECCPLISIQKWKYQLFCSAALHNTRTWGRAQLTRCIAEWSVKGWFFTFGGSFLLLKSVYHSLLRESTAFPPGHVLTCSDAQNVQWWKGVFEVMNEYRVRGIKLRNRCIKCWWLKKGHQNFLEIWVKEVWMETFLWKCAVMNFSLKHALLSTVKIRKKIHSSCHSISFLCLRVCNDFKV